MALVAEGSILTGNMYENMGTERGIANLTVSEYKHLYKQEETYRPEMVDYEVIGPKCYDVVWAIALTFNCTDRVLKEIGRWYVFFRFKHMFWVLLNMKHTYLTTIWKLFSPKCTHFW